MAPKKAVSAAQIKEDIAKITAKFMGNEPDADTTVHLGDGEFVKVYQYNGEKWEFIKRVTKAEADEEDDDDKSDDDDDISDTEPTTDKASSSEKTSSKPNAKEVAKKGKSPVDKKKTDFTLTSLKNAIENNDKITALIMIEKMMDKYGDDIMTKPKKTKRVTDPNKPQSDYHKFMAEKLSELKGDKTVPHNARMKVVSKLWAEKKAADGLAAAKSE
jgi:hypothetical protein